MLVLLSLILMVTTIFPSIDVTTLALVGGGRAGAGLLGFGLAALRSRRGAGAVTVIDAGAEVPKEQWTMPPLALPRRPGVVDRAQGRDARAARLPDRVGGPADRQGGAARRGLTARGARPFAAFRSARPAGPATIIDTDDRSLYTP